MPKEEEATTGHNLAALMRTIARYKTLETALYMTDKYAHFIDYCAAQVPYTTIPHTLVVRATTGITRPDKRAIAQFTSALSRVRDKLLATYGRDLVPDRGNGVRGTVDQADRVRTHHATLKKRAVTATAKAMAHAGTIKVNEISDPQVKKNFLAGKKELGLMSEISERMARLALPSPKKEGEST